MRYLPIIADVQLAVWRNIRRIISRFAFAQLPNPKNWRNTVALGGTILTVGLITAPVGGLVGMLTASAFMVVNSGGK